MLEENEMIRLLINVIGNADLDEEDEDVQGLYEVKVPRSLPEGFQVGMAKDYFHSQVPISFLDGVDISIYRLPVPTDGVIEKVELRVLPDSSFLRDTFGDSDEVKRCIQEQSMNLVEIFEADEYVAYSSLSGGFIERIY